LNPVLDYPEKTIENRSEIVNRKMKIQEKIDINNLIDSNNSENINQNKDLIINNDTRDNNSIILNLFRGFRFLNYLNPFNFITKPFFNYKSSKSNDEINPTTINNNCLNYN
jgi:hypothetical protein